MAEAIISLLLEKVASFAQDEILKAATAKAEIENLERRLKAIQPFARYAHNKQFNSKEVKEWVWRLNEVAYDALDVIELYRIKSLRAADPTNSLQSKVLKKTLNFVTNFPKKIRLLHKIGTKIKEINERLNTIYEEKDQYELRPMLEESSSLGEILTVLKEDRQTTSAIKETNIMGRERDEEVVIKWLSEESNPNDQQSASVIAIVGMGGVGKTALAQNIYHNRSERGCFDKCMWVCVAEMPKLLDLLKKILEEVEGEGSSLTSPNIISMKIRNHLKDKKILLVLDDVWDYGWWDELRSIWQDCGSGSKVLITTRMVQVAQAMGLTHSHELKCLNEEQSWDLLLNKALRRGESEEHLSAVKDVGRDIATRKCGGLPLALSAVGSLLRHKERRKSEWKNVLDSPFWNWQGPEEKNREVFAAIALSYMSIPYQLKQCLTYCCMYPKDFDIRKEDLVTLWVAEGFICNEQGVEIEVTAEKCLHALIGCSLIQDAGYRCKLHDIVHDFCIHLREKEYVSLGQLNNELVSHSARYISSFGGECSSKALKRQDKLRGLMCHGVDRLSGYNFDEFRWLRVLDLSRGNFLKLPKSIGDLILLKYINLSWTKIVELPESITKLSELQTLDLRWTHIKTLPNGISALAALRHLHISWTWNLDYLPHGIGKLMGLQTLGKFVVGSNNMSGGMGCSLRELGELNNLKGSLRIENLERVDSLEEVDHAQLKRKEDLRSVGLSGGLGLEFVEQVYERMQPPTGIEEISIEGYTGMKCPTWMSSSTYTCLQKITISHCAFLESLPNLGLLPNLVDLCMKKLDKLKVLDFTLDHVGDKITFPKVEALTLDHMESLEEWQFDAEIGNMPCLCRLYIRTCPKLKVIPSFSTLEDLTVSKVDEWEGWFVAKEREMPCLKKMKVSSCDKLIHLPYCPRLEEMSIESCDQLIELPCLSPVLVSATIKWCHSISCIQNMEAAKELKHLEIIGCSKMESLPQGLQCGNLKTLVIKECMNLTSIPTAIGLKRLSLRNLPQLQFLSVAFLDSINGLEELELGDALGSLQVEELLARLEVTRLRSLNLSGFQELGVEWLRSKTGDMVQLKQLVVEDCPKVQLSIIDVLKEKTLPKLQLLQFASRFPTYRPPFYWEEAHPTCELVIDSVEMSDKLAGLMLHLSSKVRSLLVRVLPGIDSLPEWIQQLHRLEGLIVYGSPQLTHLPGRLNKLTQLSRLRLDDLPELVELPAAIEDLHQLRKLVILKCPKLSSVPYGLSRLPRLQEVEIRDCPRLAERCLTKDWNIFSNIRHVFII